IRLSGNQSHRRLDRIKRFHFRVFNDEAYLLPFHVSELSQPFAEPLQHRPEVSSGTEHSNATESRRLRPGRTNTHQRECDRQAQFKRFALLHISSSLPTTIFVIHDPPHTIEPRCGGQINKQPAGTIQSGSFVVWTLAVVG